MTAWFQLFLKMLVLKNLYGNPFEMVNMETRFTAEYFVGQRG